jgi:hypothetical protein
MIRLKVDLGEAFNPRVTASDLAKLDPCEEHFWISGDRDGMKPFLRRLAPAMPQSGTKHVL